MSTLLLITCLFLVGGVFSSKAQNDTTDLAVTNLSPSDGSSLDIGMYHEFGFTIQNNGPNSISSGTQIPFQYWLGTDTAGTVTLELNSSLDSGATRNSTLNIQVPAYIDSGSIDAKFYMDYENDTMVDDTVNRQYTANKYTRDLGATKIIEPSDSSKIEIEDEVNFQFTLKNYSDTSMAAGKIVPVQILLQVQQELTPIAALFTLDEELAASDSINVVVGPFEFPQNYPDGFKIVCMSPELSDSVDMNRANNRACDIFELVGIDEGNFAEHNFEVYPNPMKDEANISYKLTSGSDVSLKIFDMTGQEIKTLVDGKQAAGQHQIKFNSIELQSGAYLYRLKTEEGIQTGRLIKQ